MGKYNNVENVNTHGITAKKAIFTGAAIGGAIGAYRDDSSFTRGSATGALGVIGSSLMITSAFNTDNSTWKGRLGWGAVGAGMVGLGVGIFNKRKKED